MSKSKSNVHQEMVMAIVWWSAAHLIHCSFLNPAETITYVKSAQQIDEMHQKLQCLQPALVNRKGLKKINISLLNYLIFDFMVSDS